MFTKEQTGMKQNKIKTIGITGSSGSGKSTICQYLKTKGAFIIDADKISHYLTKPGKICYNEIVSEFGYDILSSDGSINRKKLASIVFNDPQKLERLNEITHKKIIEEILSIKNEITEGCTEYDYIVIDAPLLIETGLYKSCDFVWLVCADYEKRIERITKRDGISRKKTEERFNNQTSFEILKKFSNEILDNSDEDKTGLYLKIDEILNRIYR